MYTHTHTHTHTYLPTICLSLYHHMYFCQCNISAHGYLLPPCTTRHINVLECPTCMNIQIQIWLRLPAYCKCISRDGFLTVWSVEIMIAPRNVTTPSMKLSTQIMKCCLVSFTQRSCLTPGTALRCLDFVQCRDPLACIFASSVAGWQLVMCDWCFKYLAVSSRPTATSNHLVHSNQNAKTSESRSQWQRGLRRRSTAARLLGLRVRVQPGAWVCVCCDCCVLSGRGLCDGLITRPEESYGCLSFVCVVCCRVEVSATSWSLIQRSPMDVCLLCVLCVVG